MGVKQISGVEVAKLVSVGPEADNKLAAVFEAVQGDEFGIILSAAQAEELAAKLFIALPPAEGERLGLTFSPECRSRFDVAEVDVMAPAARDSGFVMRLSSAGQDFVELRLSHLEAVRWSHRLAAQVAEYHLRIQN